MTKNKFVYIKVTNGLANRLRTVCSFHKFCELNNSILKICWGPSAGWSEENFYDLFENNIDLISEEDYKKICENNFCLEKFVEKNPNNQNFYIYNTDIKNILDKIKNFFHTLIMCSNNHYI